MPLTEKFPLDALPSAVTLLLRPASLADRIARPMTWPHRPTGIGLDRRLDRRTKREVEVPDLDTHEEPYGATGFFSG